MASAVRTALERGIVVSIAAIYVILQLTQIGMLVDVLGCLVFLAIALLLPKLKGLTLWLSVSFMAIGAAVMLLQYADARAWFEAAGVNVTIVTLFLFAPLFGIPVRLPAYVDALRRFYETNLRSRTALFLGTQILTQVMGVFINVGSIPVVYQMVFVKPHPGMNRLLANALNRGFAGAIFWSPYFAAMTLVTSALALPWSSVLPYLLGLAVLSVLVSWLVDLPELRQAEKEEALPQAAEKKPSAYPVELGMYLIGAIVVILAMERFVDLPMIMLICIAAVLYPLIWCIAKGAMAVYKQGLTNHVTVTFPALQKEITLFMAAGFFSGAIGTTAFGSAVPELLEQLPLPITFTFSVLTIVLIVGTSLIGLHPIVPVTMLANGIDPWSVGISPVYYGVLLLGSWAMSNPISPASAVNNLLAGLFKKPVFEMAAPNYKFAGFMAIILLVYLMVIW